MWLLLVGLLQQWRLLGLLLHTGVMPMLRRIEGCLLPKDCYN